VPPTIVALLTARLDRLSPVERLVLGAASVIGQAFYRAAVVELTARGTDEVGAGLTALLRKSLIRPERSDLPGHEALRFDHVLVRDAAYHALTKQARAELHERFAWWLDKNTDGQAYDDFVGGHLEAAYRNRADLGPLDGAARALGAAAADRLAEAGRLVLGSDDEQAVALLTRATALLPEEGQDRWSIQADLSYALGRIGQLTDATKSAQSYHDAAEAVGDEPWTMHGGLALARLRSLTVPEGAIEELRQNAERALGVFGPIGDNLGLAFAHMSLGEVANGLGRMGEVLREWELVVEYLTRAGRTRLAEIENYEAMFAWLYGDLPASRGLSDARHIASTADDRGARSFAWSMVAFFAALLGRTGDERQALAKAYTLEREMRLPSSGLPGQVGISTLVCGHGREAVDLLGWQLREMEAIGDAGHLSTVAGYQAHALLLVGDHAAARRQASLALSTGSTEDVLTVGLAHSALAWSTAAGGDEPAVVRRHIALALDILEPTDLILNRGMVHAACAEAMSLIGDGEASRHHRRTAIDLYETKENLIGAAVQRALLEGKAR
jgi:hypothetical protein